MSPTQSVEANPVQEYPITPAVRFLRERKVDFTPHLYPYVEKGGTAVSAESLGVPEHSVVKTLIFADDANKPLVVLMHGDQQVSAKELARVLGVKSVAPCEAAQAERHSGYKVGGTSPFGLRKALPILAEESIRALPRLYINGGARGFLVSLPGEQLEELLHPRWERISR